MECKDFGQLWERRTQSTREGNTLDFWVGRDRGFNDIYLSEMGSGALFLGRGHLCKYLKLLGQITLSNCFPGCCEHFKCKQTVASLRPFAVRGQGMPSCSFLEGHFHMSFLLLVDR
jgi:hypothetical protein